MKLSVCPECAGPVAVWEASPNSYLRCKYCAWGCALPPISKPSMTVNARLEFMDAVISELDHAYAKHGRDPWSKHEFYAVLLEEVEELWEAIRKDHPMEQVLEELRQVAAVCFHYYEAGDRHQGAHPLMPVREGANDR